MATVLSPETRTQSLASLRRFCSEELEADLSDIQTTALLEFACWPKGTSVRRK